MQTVVPECAIGGSERKRETNSFLQFAQGTNNSKWEASIYVWIWHEYAACNDEWVYSLLSMVFLVFLG